MEIQKFCQSCSMPLNLNGKDVRGTESDGSLSTKYCSYCYEKGRYLEPNITYEAMLTKGKKAISAGQGNPIVKWIMKATYPMLLKKTERWKK
jgi:hypothetical protein